MGRNVNGGTGFFGRLPGESLEGYPHGGMGGVADGELDDAQLADLLMYNLLTSIKLPTSV